MLVTPSHQGAATAPDSRANQAGCTYIVIILAVGCERYIQARNYYEPVTRTREPLFRRVNDMYACWMAVDLTRIEVRTAVL